MVKEKSKAKGVKKMEYGKISLNDLVNGWIIMWAGAYFFCAWLKPDVLGITTATEGATYFLILGMTMLVGLYLTANEHTEISKRTKIRRLGRIILFVVGIVECLLGVQCWIGIPKWNVPFPNKEIFTVSMSFLDLGSSALLIAKAQISTIFK